MEYTIKAKAQFEANFIIDDEQLLSYFGEEKFTTLDKEILLKQLINETENVMNWRQTELQLEITNKERL